MSLLSFTFKYIATLVTLSMIAMLLWLALFSSASSDSHPYTDHPAHDQQQHQATTIIHHDDAASHATAPAWEWDWYHYDEDLETAQHPPPSLENKRRNLLMIQATTPGPLSQLMNDITSKPNRAYAKRWGFDYLRYTGCPTDALLLAGPAAAAATNAGTHNDDAAAAADDVNPHSNANDDDTSKVEEEDEENHAPYSSITNQDEEEDVGNPWTIFSSSLSKHQPPLPAQEKSSFRISSKKQQQEKETNEDVQTEEEDEDDHGASYSPYLLHALHQLKHLEESSHLKQHTTTTTTTTKTTSFSSSEPTTTFYDAVMILDVDAVIVDMDYDVLDLLPQHALFSIRNDVFDRVVVVVDDDGAMNEEEVKEEDTTTGVLLWNLNHPESWNIVQLWMQLFEKHTANKKKGKGDKEELEKGIVDNDDDSNIHDSFADAGNGSELDALQMVLTQKYSSTTTVTKENDNHKEEGTIKEEEDTTALFDSLVHVIQKPIINFMDGTVIKFMKYSSSSSEKQQGTTSSTSEPKKMDWLLENVQHVFVSMQGIVDTTCYRFYPQCELI